MKVYNARAVHSTSKVIAALIDMRLVYDIEIMGARSIPSSSAMGGDGRGR